MKTFGIIWLNRQLLLKEKIIEAQLMAHRIISMAKRLRNEAKDYDVKFPIAYADNLEDIANEFLNKL